MKTTDWLSRLTLLWLILPLLIFAGSWLRPLVSLALSLLVLAGGVTSWQRARRESVPMRISAGALALLLLWLWLSGIGGYAFQNWDHHWRNALFRDLIVYPWPIFYEPKRMLIYYFGYWLPAAWVGKWLGWSFANGVLFLWSAFGLWLAFSLLQERWRLPAWQAAALFIFFSGMDAIGVILFGQGIGLSLWPPIQHLEVWAKTVQYSSFTTQLFWVFNQAIPAWLVTAWWLRRGDRSNALLFWALGFFLAPLPMLGLLPYLALEFGRQGWRDFVALSPSLKSRWEAVWQAFLRPALTLQNIAGLAVLFASALFFAANPAGQSWQWHLLNGERWLTFFLLEGGLLWALVGIREWKNPAWLLSGLLLALFPLGQVGFAGDFPMRASIPALFYLLSWSGEALGEWRRLPRLALILCLALGSLTPLYEINRSLYRTVQYWQHPEWRAPAPPYEPRTNFTLKAPPEVDHPYTLVADDLRTLATLRGTLSYNYIGDARRSLFYRYLLRTTP